MSVDADSRTAGDALKRNKLIAYGGLAMPLAIVEIPILVYLPAFYAQELKLAPSLVGLAFLAARLWDGLFDIVVAWLSDRTLSRRGRRKPWILGGAPFLLVSLWFLCNPPAGSGLAYLALWSALFYTFWAMVRIPYLSWGTELTNNYEQRSRVTAFREAFTIAGTLLFFAVPILFLEDGAPPHEMLMLICLIATGLTLPMLVGLSTVADPPIALRSITHPLKALLSIWQDRVFRNFAVAIMIYYIASGVLNSLAVFAFSVGLGLPNKLHLAIFTLYIAILLAVPLTMWLGKRLDKHHLLAGGLGVNAVILTAMLLIPGGDLTLTLFLWVCLGLGSATVIFLPTSILADIIDHGDVATGERRSGNYVAVYHLAFKIGIAVGIGLSFSLLDVVGYDPAATVHSAADVTNIRLIAFGLSAALMVASLLILLRNPITRSAHHALQAEISARLVREQTREI